VLLSCLESTAQRLLRVPGEVLFAYHELMEVVTEEVCACTAPVAIVYAEEGALWPGFRTTALRFYYVQDYRDPILIVVPDDTLIGISGISLYHPIASAGTLSRLIVRQRTLLGEEGDPIGRTETVLLLRLVVDALVSRGGLTSVSLLRHGRGLAIGRVGTLGVDLAL
jgi:hypothetical protein